jgi:hypothetical protein
MFFQFQRLRSLHLDEMAALPVGEAEFQGLRGDQIIGRYDAKLFEL